MRATSRTNRSAKGGARASPHYGGEGVLTHRTKVFADGTVRRSGRDPRRTSSVLGWHRGKRRHKRKRNEKQCSGSSRTGWVVPEVRRKPHLQKRGDRVGRKPAGEDGRGETGSEMSKAGEEESSLSERPGHHRPRRLADWINPTGARKVHPLIDKVYKRKNSEIARERVTDPIFRDMFRYFE
jgi:hypothetical protein